MKIFYRKNNKSTKLFFEFFSSKNVDERINVFESDNAYFESLRENIIFSIEEALKNENIEGILLKDYLGAKSQLKKKKRITKDLPLLQEKCEKYNRLRERIKHSEDLDVALENEYCKQIEHLPRLFTNEDLLLFRNEFLAQRIKKSETREIKLKKKDRISLYRYFSQMCLKTGGIGTVSNVGCFSLNENCDDIRNCKVNNRFVINVHNYLENRIYYALLLKYIDSFKGILYVNSNFVVGNGYYLFKVLVDDKTTNIFRGQEREIKIKDTSSVQWLTGQKTVSLKELSQRFSKLEIFQLFEAGILLYEHVAIGSNFNWINHRFESINEEIFHLVYSIFKKFVILSETFATNTIDGCISDIKRLCDLLEVNTLNFPVLTIDTYSDDIEISNEQKFLLSNFISQENEISKFCSIFDASKKVEELAWEYMSINYPEGKDFKNFLELDKFFHDISEFVFKKINLGALRSGFFDMKKYPLIEMVVKDICECNSEDYVIEDGFLNKIFEKAKKIKYNLEHSYSFFVQTDNEELYINHVYKGYGIFTNRYRHNYADIKFETNYGFNEILDFPYDFGFNANKRPVRRSFDMYCSYTDDNSENINYKQIKFCKCDEKKNVKIVDSEGDEINLSFLGSMTPMVFPRTLAIFNCLSLTGGMYFDVADLVLREKYARNSHQNIWKSPKILYKDKKIILSRRKILVRASFMQNILSDNDKKKVIANFRRIFSCSDFFVREFSVNIDFKNKFEKPVFVNVNSLFGIEVLSNYLEDVDYVVLEKAQPNFEEEYLKEFIIESANDI